jgi:DNA-binding transcriptional ArsR family regulator
MQPATPANYRAQARVFKALGHQTRLFMVLELGRGERCVNDLQELIGADVSTVSKHLSVLREAGLVRDERRGSQVFYSLTAPCVLSFMGCIDGLTSPGAARPREIMVTLPEDTA